MNRLYNFTSSYTSIPAKIMWAVLRRAKYGTMRPIIVVNETPNYLEALASTIELRRKTGKDYVYKIMSHETSERLDINSQSVQANFK